MNEDPLLDKVSKFMQDNLDDIRLADSQSDLDWICLRLANLIDGGGRNDV